MDLLTKKFLNSLKCPVCKSPIDIIINRINYNYCCASNVNHYKILLSKDSDGYPLLEKEMVCVSDINKQYYISKWYDNCDEDVIITEIVIRDIDLEGRVRFNFKDKKFKTDKNVFDFTEFNTEKAINRIKTILVFQ